MRVAALAVVEDLDELEDRHAERVAGWPMVPIEELGLERSEEALRDGVVRQRTLAADAANDACGTQMASEAETAVGASLVRMVHQPWRRSPRLLRHLQGAQHEVRVAHVVHRPTDDVAVEGVDDDAEVEPACIGSVLGHVGDPHAIGCVLR